MRQHEVLVVLFQLGPQLNVGYCKRLLQLRYLLHFFIETLCAHTSDINAKFRIMYVYVNVSNKYVPEGEMAPEEWYKVFMQKAFAQEQITLTENRSLIICLSLSRN